MKRSLYRLYSRGLPAVAVALLLCAAAQGQSLRKPRKDGSLPAKEYLALGVPPVDIVWSNEEYEKAADVLDKLASAHPEQLPRSGSVKSGGVFARMTAAENFANMTDKKADISIRINGFLSMKALGRIVSTYVKAINHDHENYEREYIFLFASIVMTDGQCARYVLDMLQPGATTDVEQKRVRSFLPTFRTDFVRNVTTATTIIHNAGRYDVAARTALVDSLAQHLDPMLTVLEPEQRKSIEKLLTDVTDAEPDQALRAKVNDLVKLAHQTRAPLIGSRESSSGSRNEVASGTVIPFTPEKKGGQGH